MHEQSTFRANHCYVPSTHRCTDFCEVTLGSVLYCGRKEKTAEKQQERADGKHCPELPRDKAKKTLWVLNADLRRSRSCCLVLLKPCCIQENGSANEYKKQAGSHQRATRLYHRFLFLMEPSGRTANTGLVP